MRKLRRKSRMEDPRAANARKINPPKLGRFLPVVVETKVANQKPPDSWGFHA